jgi:hypothetical protein
MSAATGTTNLGREIFLVLRGAPSATPVAEINALATNTLGGSGNISAFVATLMVRKGNDLTANATPPPTLEATGIVSIALTFQ